MYYWYMLLWILLTASMSAAVERCLDLAAGSDAASGTATGPACTGTVSAWRTPAKYHTDASAGDVLYIKRGGTLTTSVAPAFGSGALVLKGSVYAYGTGAAPHFISTVDPATNNFVGQIVAKDLTGITISGLEISGGSLRGIELRNCTSCIVDEVTIHHMTGTTANFVYMVDTNNAILRNNHFYNSYTTNPGTYVTAGVFIFVTNDTANPSDNITIEDNVFQWTDRGALILGNAYPLNTHIIRRNTFVATGNDPNVYLGNGSTGTQVLQNVILHKTNPAGTTPTQGLLTTAVEWTTTSPGPGTSRYVRNSVMEYNILGYATSSGATMNVFASNFPTGPANEQLIHNNRLCHNTIFKTNASSTTAGAFRVQDHRPTPDSTDITANVFCDNLVWESGALDNTFVLSPTTMTSTNIDLKNNFVQQSKFFGTATGTGLVQSNTVPFVSFDATDATSIGAPQNLNLTGTTTALTAGGTGNAVGALPPPLLQTVSVTAATPNKLQFTYSTVFPLTSCNPAKVSITSLTPTACAIVGTNVAEVTVSSTMGGGYRGTATTTQGFVESATIGCGTATCQAFTVTDCASCPVQSGTARNETYWVIESYADSETVTNTIPGGSAVERCLDLTAGSDTASGTATGPACTGTVSAWRTPGKYHTSAAAGDTLYIKRGGSFTTTVAPAFGSGALVLKGSVYAYGTGAPPHFISTVSGATDNFVGQIVAKDLTDVTISGVEISGSGMRGIELRNCTNCIVDGVTIHHMTGTTANYVYLVDTNNAILRNNHFYNGYTTDPGAHVTAGIYMVITNDTANVSDHIVIEDNLIQWNDRTMIQMGNAYPTTNHIIRRNTFVAAGNDPNVYLLNGSTGAQVLQNAILHKSNPAGSTPTQSLLTTGVEWTGTSPGPGTARYVRNSVMEYNILGYATSSGATMNVFSTDFPAGTANEQLLHNNAMCHNTLVKTNASSTTSGAFRVQDHRTVTDITDITSNVFCDNLVWESGALSDTFVLSPATLTTTNIDIKNNFVQQSKFFGTVTGTGLVQSNTVPFQSFDATDATSIGTPQNLNLTGTTTALTAGGTGNAVGALPPPILQTVSVDAATPNKLQFTYSTVFPLTSCDHTKLTLTSLTPMACSIVGNTVAEVTVNGTMTGGFSGTATPAQGFVESATIGCGTSTCQAFTVTSCASCPVQSGTARNETFWKIESYAHPVTAITNNIPGGSAIEGEQCGRARPIPL